MTALLVAACACAPGTGGTDAGGGDGGGGGGDRAEQYADAFLAFFDRCGAPTFGPFLATAEPIYAGIIEDQLDLSGSRDDLVANFRATEANPAIEVDDAAFDACIAFIEGPSACDAFLGGEDGSSCDEIFRGTIAEGGACGGSQECAGEAYCDQPDEDTCGVCSAFVAENGDCNAAGAQCVDGTSCDGQTCEADPPDAPDPEEGDACEVDGDECGTAVFTGLACAPATTGGTTGTCAAVTVVELDGACDTPFADVQLRLCKDSVTTTYCALSGTSPSGTCTARPGLDDPCTAQTFPICDVREAVCLNGVCVAPLAEGVACDDQATDQADCAFLHICTDRDSDDGATTCQASISVDLADDTAICE